MEKGESGSPRRDGTGMNRLEFLQELKKSFFDTVKEIALPFVEEDARKVEEAVDHLLGLRWFPISVPQEMKEGDLQSITVGKRSYYLYNKGGGSLTAVEDRCPRCGGFLHYLSYRKELRCLTCDEGAGLDRADEGYLTAAPVKQEKGNWYIGVKTDA